MSVELLPLPSVVTELGLGSPQFRLRRSCVSTLLAEVLPGMASDATLDDVVQRVSDFGKAQGLIDCSIMDGCGLACTLAYEYDIARFPPDRDRPLDPGSTFPKWRLYCHFQRLRDALDPNICSGTHPRHLLKELVLLAEMAVCDSDLQSFLAIIDRLGDLTHSDLGAVPPDKPNAWVVVKAVGDRVDSEDLCQYDARNEWLEPLARVVDPVTSFAGHSDQCFKKLVFHVLFNPENWFSPEACGVVGLRAYTLAPRAVADEWRGFNRKAEEDEDTESWLDRRGLACLTLRYMRTVGDWESLGEFLCTLQECNKQHVQPDFGAFFDCLADWTFLPQDPAPDKAELLSWRVAATMWRARRKRLLGVSFLDWLEDSDIYKPGIVDGKPRAPKRALDEYEGDANKRGCDIRL